MTLSFIKFYSKYSSPSFFSPSHYLSSHPFPSNYRHARLIIIFPSTNYFEKSDQRVPVALFYIINFLHLIRYFGLAATSFHFTTFH